MRNFFVGRAIVLSIILAIIGIGVFVHFIFYSKALPVIPVDVLQNPGPMHTVIGRSVEGRNIDAYTYGNGGTHLAFVGGIHGGYEWNSVILAFELMDYLKSNPGAIPESITITIIPSANPDGVYKVIGKEGHFTSADVSTDKEILASGRFNAREVDLNRNFDCKWQPESTWQNKTVSAGSAPFSEPEAQAIQNFILEQHPIAVVFWHSQANGVYASQCESGILPKTLSIMNIYSQASGYPAFKTFDSYATTGGADDWLAAIGIPAITVELKTHDTIDWEQNIAGIKALFEYYKTL